MFKRIRRRINTGEPIRGYTPSMLGRMLLGLGWGVREFPPVVMIVIFSTTKDMDVDLNDDWIKKFKQTDKLYQDFYTDDVYYINTRYVYVNKSNEIEHIKQDSVLMSSKNYISREELIGMLKRNSKDFSIMSILKYNITLDVEDVHHFMNNNSTNKYDHFLTNVKNIDSVIFEKTINMFQDLNELVFVFHEKTNKSSVAVTKKVFIYSNHHKKTVRKQYNSSNL